MDEDTSETPHNALRRQHRKLNQIIRGQAEDSESIDSSAAAMLRASFTFTSIFSAVVYYSLRVAPPDLVSGIDNPITYSALFFGVGSLLLSVLAITHTKIESELNPEDIKKQASFGDRALLLTAVETYPNYIERNESRLATDKRLLALSQYSLLVAVITIASSVVFVLFDRSITFLCIVAVTFVTGVLCGSGLMMVWLSYLSEPDSHSNQRES